MAQQDNPYEDQDIWNDLSEAGSEMKNVFNEMTNNYFTENSFLSAVGNLMKSWIHGNKAFSILALLPLFTISTRLSFCRTFLPYNNHVLVLLFGTVASLFYHYRHHCIDSLYYTMG